MRESNSAVLVRWEQLEVKGVFKAPDCLSPQMLVHLLADIGGYVGCQTRWKKALFEISFGFLMGVERKSLALCTDRDGLRLR